MCHTRINALGGSSELQVFEGGLIPMQNRDAPALTSNREAGLGDWSIEEITDLLKKGISNRGVVYGPMAEVNYNSLQHLSDADTRAMAVYLKSLAPHETSNGPASAISPAESSLLIRLGRSIYEQQCETCHGADGRGDPPALPGARRQPVDPDDLGRQRHPHGAEWRDPPATAGNPEPYGMPPFAQTLADDEVAAVVSYIRVAWGNRGSPVTAREANELRSAPLD